VTDTENGVTTLYSSATKAAAAIGCHRSTIIDRISSNSLLPIKNKFIVKEPSNNE